MHVIIHHAEKRYQADFSQPLDISIPLNAAGENVNAFHAPPFKAEPVVSGSFTGSVAKGGSVNFLNVRINPHGNGTHTECVGHITEESFTINQCLRKFFFVAELISVAPVKMRNGDDVILREQAEAILDGKTPEALIIRTLPNDVSKLQKNYSGKNPPYLHHALASFLADIGVKHLLVDLPSVDREHDEGKLLFHKTFWKYPDDVRSDATITELIFAPAGIEDGTYLLNLQIASFELDASPGKPVLYRMKQV